MFSYRRILTGLIAVSLLTACSNSPTAPSSQPQPPVQPPPPPPPQPQPLPAPILSALLTISTPVSGQATGIVASPADSTRNGGGMRFADADCSEELPLVFDSAATEVRGDTLSVGGTVTGTELCVYYADGRVSGPGYSPLGGPDGSAAPFTSQLWADSIAIQLLYHNPRELVATGELPATVLVNAIGSFTDSVSVYGIWMCAGKCGSTGLGAAGTWTLVVQR
jgi:hypothetical protein